MIHSHTRAPSLWRLGTCFGLLSAVALFGGSSTATAAATFDPYAGFTVEHNTNLFAVPAGSTANGALSGGDTLSTLVGGAEANWVAGRQRLYATLEARRTLYDRFSYLNHNEYLVNLGLSWKLLRIFDGTIDARQSHQIVVFADRTNVNTTLTTQTDRIVKATLDIAVSPVWLADGSVALHTADSPLPTAPAFSLREVTESAGIKYLGIANLSYGLEVNHVNGEYTGAPTNLAPGFLAGGGLDYKQDAAQFVANYLVTKVTTLNGAVGYTRRRLTARDDTVSGITGLLGYSRQLTGKTSVSLQFSRLINSYYNAGGSEIDTGGTFGVVWQTTPKLGVTLNLGRMHSTFEGQAIIQNDTQGRSDNSTNYGLELNYKPRQWVVIKAYGRHQVRDSNIELFNYSGNTYGIDVRFRKEKPKGA